MNNTYSDMRQFTIQQLSERLDIPKPTLRFWENELEGIILPLRSAGGQRRYTEEHIIVLEQIKNLRASGKSITEIKDYFRNNYNRENQADEETAIDMLTQRIAELVKLEVTKFLGLK